MELTMKISLNWYSFNCHMFDTSRNTAMAKQRVKKINNSNRSEKTMYATKNGCVLSKQRRKNKNIFCWWRCQSQRWIDSKIYSAVRMNMNQAITSCGNESLNHCCVFIFKLKLYPMCRVLRGVFFSCFAVNPAGFYCAHHRLLCSSRSLYTHKDFAFDSDPSINILRYSH